MYVSVQSVYPIIFNQILCFFVCAYSFLFFFYIWNDNKIVLSESFFSIFIYCMYVVKWRHLVATFYTCKTLNSLYRLGK